MPAVINIPGLPAATSVNGTELLWAVQNGRDVRVTSAQVASLGGGGGGGGGGNVPANLVPSNGVLIASGTSAVRVVDPGVSGQVLTSNGAGIPPTYQAAPSGTVAGGGTGLNSVPAGDLLAGNGVNPLLLIDPGTTGQVLTSNGPGVPPSMQNAASSSGTVPQGGTGRATLAAHGVMIGEGTAAINVTTPGTAGQVLTSNGASADPTFQAVPTPVIDVPHGGTGVATLFAHGLLVGNGTAVVQVTSPGTAGQVLTSNGAGADPTMQNLAVTVVQGGTGASTLTIHGVVIGQGTSPVNVTAAGTAGQALISNGAGADPTFQTIPIPNVDVPHGGTGVATLTTHGVVIGQGMAAVHITGAGTTGQFLVSNGASADPTFQAMPWPPTGAPDFATKLAADAAAGKFTDWVYGDVTLTAPLTINLTATVNNIGLDMHGANLICGFSAPTSNMITYFCPDTNVDVNVDGLSFRNFFLFGNSGCLNGIMLSARLGSASGIFNGNFTNVHAIGCSNGSGILMYGNVFEYDLVSCSGRDCLIGFEMRNPTAGGGVGVISSIKVIGGDYRANIHYGIASTADTAFQEAVGFHVISSDFIGNGYPGIHGGSGIALVFATHLERNCTDAGTPSRAAIYTAGGPGTFVNCDSADNSGRTLYVVDIGGANVLQLTTCWLCGANDEGTGFGMKIGLLRGGGTLVTDFQNSSGGIAANFDGDGAWITQTAAYVQGAI